MAYHNMGVILQRQQQYGGAIEQYKQALRLRPNDNETRYNLVLCQRQNRNNQNNKDNNNSGGDNNKNNKDNKDKNKDKDNNKENQDKDKQDKQNKQEPETKNQLSKENAERLLNAAMQVEK